MVDLLGDKRGVQNTVAKRLLRQKVGYSWTEGDLFGQREQALLTLMIKAMNCELVYL